MRFFRPTILVATEGVGTRRDDCGASVRVRRGRSATESAALLPDLHVIDLEFRKPFQAKPWKPSSFLGGRRINIATSS